MFRIRPKAKLLTPSEKHCCVNGKTPTEYDLFGTLPVESVVDNGDGTWTTNWVMDGGQSFVWQIHFTLCCSEILNITAHDDNVSSEAGLLVYLNDYLFYENYDLSSPVSIDIDQETGAEDYFPAGACGINVMIEGQDMEESGNTITITHGKASS